MKKIIFILFVFFGIKSNSQSISMTEFDQLILKDTSIALLQTNQIPTSASIQRKENFNPIKEDPNSRKYAAHQIEFIHSLIDEGNINGALARLEQTVADYESGIQKHLRFGAFKDKTNVFCNLYKNGNESIRKDVKKILLDLLLKDPLNKDSEIIYPLLIIDSVLTRNVLIEEFRATNSSKDIDFSDRQNRSKYCSNLFLYAPIIASEIGIEFWNGYIERKDYFNDYNAPFDIYSVAFAYYCNQKSLLNTDQKKSILDYICKNNSYVNRQSNWFQDYNSLINIYFPELTEDEIKSFIPAKYLNDPYRKSFKIPKLDTLPIFEDFVGEMEQAFGKIENLDLNDQCFFKYTNGFYTINNFKQNLSHLLSHFLKSTESFIVLSPDYGFVPVQHDQYFTENILPKLKSNFASVNFNIDQIVTKIEEGYHYEIIIGNEKKSYKFNYESASDYFNYAPIIKALNLLLIENKETKRLVNIDQAVIICDPEKAKPAFEKYNLNAYPLNPSDQWIKQ